MSLPRVKNGPQIETHDIEGRREEMEVIEGKQVQRVDIVAVHPPAVGDAAPGPIQGPSGQGRDLNDQCKRIYDIVAATGTYNFMGARCPVPSAFDIPAWRRRLAGYRDAGILQYLQYGWPINFNRFSPLCPTDRNHPSAVNFQEDIEHYLRTERGHGALLGPFAGQPVEHAHSSPLMTRPKKDARYRRVIVDLSWPQGASINDGVDQVHYLDGPATVKLPTAEYMVQRILQLGTGAWLYKTDLARGYRQLRVDPLDWASDMGGAGIWTLAHRSASDQQLCACRELRKLSVTCTRRRASCRGLISTTLGGPRPERNGHFGHSGRFRPSCGSWGWPRRSTRCIYQHNGWYGLASYTTRWTCGCPSLKTRWPRSWRSCSSGMVGR